MNPASEAPSTELPPPELMLIGTPIGNLDDLSERAKQALREADTVLAEDTRHTRKLLERFDIQQRPMSYHKFNEASRCDWIISELEAGKRIALVTDGGMPGVSDPGARAVKAVQEAGLRITVIPGPSAVTSAAALSGLCEEGFAFHGFLRVKSGGRAKDVEELVEASRAVILFESPHRIRKLLAEIQERMPDRQVYVGRELTKKFEESLWGTAGEIAARFEGRSPKGEFVVVVAKAVIKKKKREKQVPDGGKKQKRSSPPEH